MYITGLGTARPAHGYTQSQCLEALEKGAVFRALRPASQRLAQKILQGAHGIDRRYFVLSDLSDIFDITPDALHKRFASAAPALATAAAKKALSRAALAPRDIDAVIISTCTGYLCPGLTSYVTEALGLRPDVLGLDLVGQGCGAAIPNMRAGYGLIEGGGRHVLSICVEVCSSAFYLDDDPGTLVSACLFADGAGAAILSDKPRGHGPSLKWRDSDTVICTEHRDLLRFEQSSGMLKNRLSPQVPELAADYAARVLGTVLVRNGLDRNAVSTWLWHGGGKNVLDAIRTHLDLDESDVALSRKVLSSGGNVSSAFIYFVLEAALQDFSAERWWWMSTFGAGFSCHGVLLRTEAA